MPGQFARFHSVLGRPLRARSRILLLGLLLPLVASLFVPLWRIRMVAPQYPQGLRMDIHASRLTGGHDGHDIAEINNLNHYIGMAKIEQSSIPELGWIPFAFGVLGLLAMRAAVIGVIRDLVDLSVLLVYVTAFFFARFVLMLYNYGHRLDPHAAFQVKPFMPAVIGTKQVANFTTHSLPQWGTLLVGIFAIGVVLIAAWHIRTEWRNGKA